jgi:protein arginine kinase
MKENNKLHPFFCQNTLWANNENTVWLGSTINLFRNIEKFKFPAKINGERRSQIVALLSKEFQSIPSLQKPTLFKAEELSSMQKEYLVEHFLSNQSYHSASTGEAFIVDETGQIMISINLRNHLHFVYIDTKTDIETAWAQLVKVETGLGGLISYSYSPKFGFLTADVTECGTALAVVVYLQLSGLIHSGKIDDALEKLVDESFNVSGIQGSPTEIIGDVLAIQNNYTIGVTEENIISSLRTVSTKLLVEERAARTHIKQDKNAEIKDKVSRAFGILIHSYQIEAVEALNAISLLKFGHDLGWLQGVTVSQLNQLFFNCRRAHLLCQSDEKVPQEELTHARAEFIHKTLKDAKLTI